MLFDNSRILAYFERLKTALESVRIILSESYTFVLVSFRMLSRVIECNYIFPGSATLLDQILVNSKMISTNVDVVIR